MPRDLCAQRQRQWIPLICAGDVSSLPRWKIIGPGGGGSMYQPVISPHDPKLAVLHCDMTEAYLTADGGASWRELNLRTTIGAFAFDPVHLNILYAGSDGLFRSDDRGETWRLVFPDPKTTLFRRRYTSRAGMRKFANCRNSRTRCGGWF